MALHFADFIAKFPPVNMPVTLGEESHHLFSSENEPLSEALIAQFIASFYGEEADDPYTEFIPCFSFEDTKDFVASVWLRAALLQYEYRLTTYTLRGEVISTQVIAFTQVEADQVRRAVCNINEDWEISIAEGVADRTDQFDPTSSKTKFMEVLANGEIVVG